MTARDVLKTEAAVLSGGTDVEGEENEVIASPQLDDGASAESALS